jgi:hypothetical protein
MKIEDTQSLMHEIHALRRELTELRVRVSGLERLAQAPPPAVLWGTPVPTFTTDPRYEFRTTREPDQSGYARGAL